MDLIKLKQLQMGEKSISEKRYVYYCDPVSQCKEFPNASLTIISFH